MKYQELNLKKIREDNGLDFAHFTYLRNMCSCCSTPLEFPARYWHKGIKPTSMDNVQYLIFKNADNGSGRVTKNDDISEYECISWNFPIEKMGKICQDLERQMGKEYEILVPSSEHFCIIAVLKDRKNLLERELEKGYKKLSDYLISPQAFAEQVKRIIDEAGDDYERSHLELDALLCRVLEQNGYGDGVKVYQKAPKW